MHARWQTYSYALWMRLVGCQVLVLRSGALQGCSSCCSRAQMSIARLECGLEHVPAGVPRLLKHCKRHRGCDKSPMLHGCQASTLLLLASDRVAGLVTYPCIAVKTSAACWQTCVRAEQ